MKGHLISYFPRSKLLMMLSVIAITVLPGIIAATGALRIYSPRAAYAATPSDDWPTYLFNNRGIGFNGAETIINPTTAPNLKLHWADLAGAASSDQSVEANSLIYWGSWDGFEHATNLSGTDVWTTNLGTSTASCSPTPTGVGSTSTVVSVVINGMATLVDFVGGGNGVFYALDASTGAIIWQTPLRVQPNDFLWSSPLFYNGSIYEGVAAISDCPTVQGRLVQLDATTGAIQNTFDVVPNGCTGGGIWGSPVVNIATGMLFFATGNPTGKKCSPIEPYAPALVQLNAANLSFVSAWQVPSAQQTSDSDFGSTPTLFQVTVNGVKQEFIGIGNKNGIFYAFNRAKISMGPVWQDQIAIGGGGPVQGQGVISPAAWNGSSLFVAGGNTTINGNSCQGSLRALDPTTGAFLWQDCLSSPIIGAVSGVPGVIVGDSLHAMVVVSAKTGSTFFTYQPTHGQFWSGASISNGVLYVTNSNHNLYAFGL